MRDELLSITKIALINGNADGMPILSVMKQGTFKAGTKKSFFQHTTDMSIIEMSGSVESGHEPNCTCCGH